MKQEPIFKTKDNKLFFITSDLELKTDKLNLINLEQIENGTANLSESKSQLTAVLINWSKIDLGNVNEQNYNEELLALLRDFLKKLENTERFAFLIPIGDKNLSDSDCYDSFFRAMVHVARRVKDCECVVGFALPTCILQQDEKNGFGENSYSQWFINEMSKKHAHYLYFVEKSFCKENINFVSYSI